MDVSNSQAVNIVDSVSCDFLSPFFMSIFLL